MIGYIVARKKGSTSTVLAGFIFGLGLWINRRSVSVWISGAILLSALFVGDLCFSQLILSETYKFAACFSPTIKDGVRLFEVASILLFFVVWGLPGTFCRNTRWYLFFVLLFLSGTLANPFRSLYEQQRENPSGSSAHAEIAQFQHQSAGGRLPRPVKRDGHTDAYCTKSPSNMS